jgi:protein-S-isoprenylcysteine O-methyltransferase Ste14
VSGWRHARAIALLPDTVTLVVPTLILILGEGPRGGWGLDGVAAALPVLLGAALIAAGLALWAWTVRLFSRIGKGTVAPWDPISRLVGGPCRHARNPMISGVLAILLGEAALLGSPALLLWSTAFFAINHAYFLLFEETGLERRFGDEYRRYKQGVPRWIPRRTPWREGSLSRSPAGS